MSEQRKGFFGVRGLVCVAVASCLMLGLAASDAAAAVAPGAGWMIESQAMPTNFSAADNERCLSAGLEEIETHCDSYTVTLRNSGSVSAGGGATLSDTLPEGLSVRRVSLYFPGLARLLEADPAEDLFPKLEEFGLCSSSPLSCLLPFFVAPDEAVKLIAYVTVDEAAARSLKNVAEVSGGGVPSASTESSNQVSPAPARFGFSNFRFYIAGLDGAPDRQAGDHPYGVTTTIGLNNDLRVEPEARFGPTSVQDVRDVVTDLPVGFVGSILAAPQCSFSQLSSAIGTGEGGCPRETIIGHIRVQAPGTHLSSINSPIYNMQPERGVPAEFAYVDLTSETHVFYAHVVPTAKGYVLRVVNHEIPQIAITNITVIFYGDPAQRDETGNLPLPFFTNPSDCTGEEPTTTIYMDSWQNPARLNPDGTPVDLQEAAWAKAQSTSPPMTGCPALQFPAEINAQPTTREADKPSGMSFEIKLPQSETMGVPATPTLKKAVVTLPEGLTVDPSAGDGLQACSEAQIGWLGGTRLNFSPAAPECPEASKIGSITLESPLVGHQLEGEMFLARQYENPFGSPEHPGGSLLAAYVVVDDPITGVLIKIPGKFEPDPRTGRLTAVFDENPNLPFSDLQLHFFGGPRAELATPESCGTFTVNTEMSPYSLEGSELPATPFDNFAIDEACPSGAFDPSFTAGSLNLQAGAYTPFVASFGRSDTDQELAGLSVTLPPGLSAVVAGVPQCTDAQIHAAETGSGECPQASQVGTVKAGVGPGPNPFFATGKVYWTGPYNGGPFGLVVVVPAVAGPFNFGTVVVRQSIRIDPATAQVTDVSDPFPTIIDGIPLRMRRVDLELNRPGFTFNPTSCEKLAFNGTIAGSPLGAPRTLNDTVGYATQTGATSGFSTPLQVTNCATLAFKPRFSVSTSGKPSRANGASLHVKLTYPKAPFGSQANIKSVKVELPKQLPSRLKTLQKACLAAQFQANPAGCPAASMVGHATAITPLIPVPLTGPAYFVSYGGAKFPELVIVLQGDGITLDLHGETFISKAGITSSTFHAVPDAPVNSFELTLPQGPFSALAANGNLCKSTMKMPTAFVAQNGATIKQNTPITATGCAKKKTHKAKRRHRKK